VRCALTEETYPVGSNHKIEHAGWASQIVKRYHVTVNPITRTEELLIDLWLDANKLEPTRMFHVRKVYLDTDQAHMLFECVN
jgi:hypothetical protein